MSYKLSICIPTYNRGLLLEWAVSKIVEQIIQEELTSSVEICISDNASLDITSEVVGRFNKLPVNIQYFRQSENVGFSRNIYRAIEMAQGEYVSLTGDDDLINDGALKNILEAIKLEKDIIIFNTLSGESDFLKNLDVNQTSPRAIKNGIQAVELLGAFHLSFIGNIVIRKYTYLTNHHSSDFDSAYPHTCVLLKALQKTSAVFINRSIYSWDDSMRKHNQSLLTAVDMSRVHTEYLLSLTGSEYLIDKTYSHFVRSIPRAILTLKQSTKKSYVNNPYASLTITNILDCYRCSYKYQTLAILFWLACWLIPPRILANILPTTKS